MALIYPDQGGWTIDDYLRLDIGRHVEFSNGTVEFQPMPDERHQAIVFFLIQALKAYASAHGGKATMAPFPLRLKEGEYAVHGVFTKGQTAASRAVPDFQVGVTEALEAK